MLKISRGGKILGDFSREEVIEGLTKGTFSPKDYFWDPQNKDLGWQNLSSLLPAGAAPAPTPPAPPKRPAESKPAESIKSQNGGILKNTSGWEVIGGMISGWGAINYVKALAGDPNGSAIRQAVLEQWQTNGLLLVIAGLLMGIYERLCRRDHRGS